MRTLIYYTNAVGLFYFRLWDGVVRLQLERIFCSVCCWDFEVDDDLVFWFPPVIRNFFSGQGQN